MDSSKGPFQTTVPECANKVSAGVRSRGCSRPTYARYTTRSDLGVPYSVASNQPLYISYEPHHHSPFADMMQPYDIWE